MHVRVTTSRTGDDAKPYGFTVTWIPWDSGFRKSGLRIGDVITAIDDKVFTPAKKDFDFDQYGEEMFWEKSGAHDGTPTALTVVRGGETLKIAGKVRADRFYSSDEGRRTIGLDGPEDLAKDGFDSAWSFWSERIVQQMSEAPGAAFQQNTRMLLESLEEHTARIDYLSQHFPSSAFARAMKEDFDAAIGVLKGTKYDLAPEDLAYRTLGARRVEEAVAAGKAARDALVQKLGAVPLSSLPPAHPIRGDRSAVTGKIVVLPELTDLISEAGHGWYVALGAASSVYLLDTRSEAFVGILRAVYRFEQIVAPGVNERHEFIARITGQPAMVATPTTLYQGIVLEILADFVDGKVFVDASAGGSEPRFANEENLHKPAGVDQRPDMSPMETMRAFTNSLKLGDQDLWQSFFAPWSCDATGIGGEYAYDPDGGPSPNAHDLDYLHARKIILGSVYDLRVVSEEKPRVVYDKSGTRVEEIVLVVDPVGLFDGEYRAFKSVDVHRTWQMQRVNGGPWRVTSEQGI